MASHSRTLTTTATPEAIWKLWSDPQTWGQWNPDVETCQLDGPMADGASGTMRTRSGGEHQISIESVEPGRAFTLVSTAIPGHRFAFTCSIEGAGDASSITQSLSIRGPLKGLFNMMMGERVADAFPAILGGLKAAAEAERS
ncbi:MAG TPA: SRPBCC family protein [Candidatus Dormibacteraeota bacterium]|jgi:uncharacterized protein YndB with AHSA1/START domain|nr:SRPBCC family protein [Candidatus Dormibacteraeota bacterium]